MKENDQLGGRRKGLGWLWRRAAILYLAISVFLGVGVWVLREALQERLSIDQRSYDMQQLALDLEQSLEQVSDSARNFVHTGHRENLNDWWRLVEKRPDLDRQLARARTLGAGKQDQKLLADAFVVFDSLVSSETQALQLTARAHGMRQVDVPPQVQYRPDAVPQDEPSTAALMASALDQISCPYYNQQKGRLEQYLRSFQEGVASRLAKSRERADMVAAGAMFVLICLSLIVPLLLAVELFRRRALEERTKLMITLGESLSGVTSPSKAARLIVRTADRLMGWDACMVAVYDKEAGGLKVLVAYDVIDGKRTEITASENMEVGPPYSEALSEPRLTLRKKGDLTPPSITPFGDTSRMSASLMYVPIRKGARAVGVLSVQSYKHNAYSQRDMDDLQWLADRCGVGLDRSRLHEELRNSEERYRVLLENNLDGVYLIQGDRFHYCNAAYARIFGYSDPSDIVDHLAVSDLIAPEDRERMRDSLGRRFAGEAPSERFVFLGLCRDGSRISCEVLGTRIEYEGQPVVLGTLRDVSERERTATEIKRLHDLYRRTVQALGAIPYTLDYETGVYDFFGGDCRWLLGYANDELNAEVFSARVRQKHFYGGLEDVDSRERYSRALKGEYPNIRVDVQFERKDGSLVWLADASIPRYDEKGTVRGSLGVLLDITERKRAEERARIFGSVGQRLSEVTSAAQAAQVIADVADQLFGWDSCSINLYDADQDITTRIFSRDTINGVRQSATTNPEKGKPTPITRKVLTDGPVLILREPDAMDSHPELVRFGESARPSASLMFVPIFKGDRAVGCVTFQSYRFFAYTDRDLQDLQALAEHCAAGLERARLYEMLNDSEEEFRAVWENAGSGMRITDAEGIIRMVNPAFCKLVGMPREQLEGRPYCIYYTPSIRDRVMLRYRERFSRRAMDEVRERTMLLWNGHEITFQISNSFFQRRGETLLIGVFTDRTAEKELEMELRRSAQELERLARTDSLTGLLNRRAFLERLEEEFARAQRYGSPLSVLMLDLDHFKQVNDKYGHLVGDMVLSRTGELIREMVRTSDIAGRYGGEELCVAMPETPLEGARIFAERVRVQFSRQAFTAENGERFRVTCSIGIGQLVDQRDDVNQVIARADRALYLAKQTGRDRVCA